MLAQAKILLRQIWRPLFQILNIRLYNGLKKIYATNLDTRHLRKLDILTVVVAKSRLLNSDDFKSKNWRIKFLFLTRLNFHTFSVERLAFFCLQNLLTPAGMSERNFRLIHFYVRRDSNNFNLSVFLGQLVPNRIVLF